MGYPMRHMRDNRYISPAWQVGKLDAVLAPPMLGHWQGQARAAKAAGR